MSSIRGGNPAAIASAVGNLLPIGHIVNAISSAVNKDKEKEIANIQKETEMLKSEEGQKILKVQSRAQTKKTKYYVELDRMWDNGRIPELEYSFIKYYLEGYLAEEMQNEFLSDTPPGPIKPLTEVIADIKETLPKEYAKVLAGTWKPPFAGRGSTRTHANAGVNYEAFILQKSNEIRQASLQAPKYTY